MFYTKFAAVFMSPNFTFLVNMPHNVSLLNGKVDFVK